MSNRSSSLAVSWRKFKRNWQNYQVAAKLNKEDGPYRCAVLLTCIGDEALEVYDGFAIDKTTETLDIILSKFEEFCVGEPNEIYETYVFHLRQQQSDEKVDAYLAELRKLAKTCNFGAMEERMIRDRMVIGIIDDEVRKELLEKKDLTLSSCLDLVRAHELAKS